MPIKYAGFKRVMEWYISDPEFRKSMEKEIPQLLFKLELSEKADLIREAIKTILQGRFQSREAMENPFVREYTLRNQHVSELLEKRMGREFFAADAIWQYSNVVRNRCRTENRMIRMHSNIYYYPVCFELSSGCRVQCPFCGFAAEPWSGDFRYTKENALLWRDVLEITKELLGKAAGAAPCYFATEPLDNPDYESFLKDIKEVFGSVPQTTTAVAEKAPKRIRALICLLGEEELREKNALRFSIRNLGQFHRIMELYTPEELEHIELLHNNPESVYQYSDSGRTAESHSLISEGKRLRYSISCLAGIRVNMERGTISFLEPEQPDADYPLGIRTRETISFHDAGTYRKGVIRLFQSYAFGELPYYVPVQLNRNIRVEHSKNEIWLLGDQIGYRLNANLLLVLAIQKLERGISPKELSKELGIAGATEEKLYSLLNELYVRGYICLE